MGLDYTSWALESQRTSMCSGHIVIVYVLHICWFLFCFFIVWSFFFLHLFFIYLFMCVCAHIHTPWPHMEVRSCRTWWQSPLSTEPSHWPWAFFLMQLRSSSAQKENVSITHRKDKEPLLGLDTSHSQNILQRLHPGSVPALLAENT